ncbi:probable F-box protein At4g22030 [Prosopis cineraria]|uniref:probable F-box protein At4g22030 n=1 Tax=Prosopis cineraria TaxID=364024 RepID=UPI00240F4ACA|nr:probable F-box protein At4g22030 [Prosopis cineraria]
MATSILQSSISSLNVSKLHYYPRRCFSALNSASSSSSSRKLAQKSKASMKEISLEDHINIKGEGFYNLHHESNNNTATLQLYAILETICDRIEKHHNVGDQRDNWNSLLLNSVNTITLAATTMAGVAASIHDGAAPLKLSSTLLFSAATLLSLVMNKIQPSQLAEEQRNATRLFKQLQAQIQTTIAIGNATEKDVNSAIERVLALDRAYPLALLGGAMLEKFPSKFEPAIWWPSKRNQQESSSSPTTTTSKKGWSEELEMEMREIIEVVKRKDMEDYERLGNLALKMNKIMAISGSLLTGIAALGSATTSLGNINSDNGSWWGSLMMTVPAVAGSMASVVNAFEHGGQVGMVLDMYRYCGGFFKLLEETTEATLEEKNYERRENGEMFEMKMALNLGRNVSQLRELASKSAFCRAEGVEIDEFASKLF